MPKRHQPGCPCCCPAKLCITVSACRNPFVGVDVRVTGPGGYDSTKTTGSDGKVCFAGLTPGSYSITIPTPPEGFLSPTSRGVVVASGGCFYSLAIVLRAAEYNVCITVFGCPTCEGPHPLEGVTVDLLILGDEDGVTGTTDEDGVVCLQIPGDRLPEDGTAIEISITAHSPGTGYLDTTGCLSAAGVPLEITIHDCSTHCSIQLEIDPDYVCCACCGEPMSRVLHAIDRGGLITLTYGADDGGPCVITDPHFANMPWCQAVKNYVCYWAGSITWDEAEAGQRKYHAPPLGNPCYCCDKVTRPVTVWYRLFCACEEIDTSSGPTYQHSWRLVRCFFLCEDVCQYLAPEGPNPEGTDPEGSDPDPDPDPFPNCPDHREPPRLGSNTVEDTGGPITPLDGRTNWLGDCMPPVYEEVGCGDGVENLSLAFQDATGEWTNGPPNTLPTELREVITVFEF